jgi:hypothetical protein
MTKYKFILLPCLTYRDFSKPVHHFAVMASCNTSIASRLRSTAHRVTLPYQRPQSSSAGSSYLSNKKTVDLKRGFATTSIFIPASAVACSVFSTEIWFCRNSSVVNFPAFRAAHRTVYDPLQPHKLLDVPRVRFFCSFRPSIQTFHIARRWGRASLARACPPV